MLTKLCQTEWMVEPDDDDAREYARLHISANRNGILIDGQATIPWGQVFDAYDQLEREEMEFDKKGKK